MSSKHKESSIGLMNLILATISTLGAISFLINLSDYGITSTPIRPDELWYVANSVIGEYHTKLHFRQFHFFLGKFITFLTAETPLRGAYFTSLLCSALIVLSPLLLFRQLGLLGISLCIAVILSNPVFLYQSGWFGTDLTFTAFGLYCIIFTLLGLEKNKFGFIFVGGCCLVFAIFAKQTAITLIPALIFITFAYRTPKREMLIFLSGATASILILCLISGVVMLDYTRIVDPETYKKIFLRFFQQLGEDRLSRRPSDSFLTTVLEYNQLFIPVIFVSSLLFLNSCLKTKFLRMPSEERVAGSLFIVGISIVFIHEGTHAFYPGLALWPRYLSPAFVFCVISLFVYLSDLCRVIAIERFVFYIGTFLFYLAVSNALSFNTSTILWYDKILSPWIFGLVFVVASILIIADPNAIRPTQKTKILTVAMLFFSVSWALIAGINRAEERKEAMNWRYVDGSTFIENTTNCTTLQFLPAEAGFSYFYAANLLLANGVISAEDYRALNPSGRNNDIKRVVVRLQSTEQHTCIVGPIGDKKYIGPNKLPKIRMVKGNKDAS